MTISNSLPTPLSKLNFSNFRKRKHSNRMAIPFTIKLALAKHGLEFGRPQALAIHRPHHLFSPLPTIHSSVPSLLRPSSLCRARCCHGEESMPRLCRCYSLAVVHRCSLASSARARCHYREGVNASDSSPLGRVPPPARWEMRRPSS